MMKKVIGRILKFINIIINLAMGFIATAAFMHFGTSGYMYHDDILRLPWMVGMMVLVNTIDYLIQQKIKEF